jgi:DNA-binding transcriptional MerR regulator
MAQRSKKREDNSSDGKIYYRIGEVSRITGVKPYVLRYWESEFRWMAPAKSRSKQRLYRKRDIEVIQLIKRLLYEERYTIAGARKKLRDLGVGRALETPRPRIAQDRDPQVFLRRIRDELQSIRGML